MRLKRLIWPTVAVALVVVVAAGVLAALDVLPKWAAASLGALAVLAGAVVGVGGNLLAARIERRTDEKELRRALRQELQPLQQAFAEMNYHRVELRVPLRRQFAPLIEDRTKLFGGRAAELNIVREFFEQQAGGYLVITAPAGFGKTALACSLALAAGDSLAYHFLTPIYEDGLSEFFFLRNLVEQMAVWHDRNELVPSQIDDLRALYHELLGVSLERPRAMMIDGLDEVRYWKLAPYLSRRLPEGMHIVVTVRNVGQDWCAEYGLPAEQVRHLALGGLQRDEVAEVLIGAGEKAAVLAASKPLDEVMRVAAYDADQRLGADPFYVRLLAEDAQSGELTGEDIAKRPTGLDGYLDSWWQTVKASAGEAAVRDLLGTLTAALGPIRRQELEALNESLVDRWHADRFVDVLREVRRFVVGDEQDGYSLVHPRFRAYMRDRTRVETYEARLLDHCSEWADHHSPYALRHYAEHLVAAGRSDDLHRLLALETDDGKNAWYEAQEDADNVDGYLRDLSASWSVLRVSDPDTAWLATRYGLMEGSITSQATNLEPSDLGDAVRTGVWGVGQALSYARRLVTPHTRAAGLVEVAVLMDPHAQEPILREAIQAVAHAAEGERDWIALDVVPVIASLGYHQAAVEALEQSESVELAARITAEIAAYLEEDELERICELADELNSPSWPIQFRVAVAPYLGDSRRKEVAIRMLKMLGKLTASDDRRFPVGHYAQRGLLVKHRPVLALIGYNLEQVITNSLDGWKVLMAHRLLPHVDGSRAAIAQEYLEVADRIDTPGLRAVARHLLLSFLPLSDRRTVQEDIEREISALPEELLMSWEPALAELPSVLSDHLMEAAARGLVTASPTRASEKGLADFIAVLPRSALDYAFAYATQRLTGEEQAVVISAVSARRARLEAMEAATFAGRREPLQIASHWSDAPDAPSTGEDDRVSLDRHLRDATTIGDTAAQAVCLAALSSIASNDAAVEEAVEAIAALDANGAVHEGVSFLLPALSVAQVRRLIEAVGQLEEVPDGYNVPTRHQVLKPLLLGLAERGAPDEVMQLLTDFGAETRMMTGPALAAYVTPEAREVLLRDALDAFRELGRSYPAVSRADMAEIVEHLADELLPEALDAAAVHYNDYWSSRAMAAVASKAKPTLLSDIKRYSELLGDSNARERVIAASAPLIAQVSGADAALSRVMSISNGVIRSLGLAALAPSLGRARGSTFLKSIRGIAEEHARGDAIHAVAPHVDEAHCSELTDVANELDDLDDRAIALAGLASAGSGERRADFAHKAMAAALDDWRRQHGTLLSFVDRSIEAVVEVAPYLSPTRRETAVAEVIHFLDQSPDRRRLLAKLATSISAKPATSCLEVWLEAIKASSRQPREDVLLDIAALTPLLQGVGHVEATPQSYQAIGLVAKWWP